ncbi:MAG: cell division protein FtsL [Ignavibacteria bacterium]|nr:cell division protein FtsL [Ignavibacteriota bacterium]
MNSKRQKSKKISIFYFLIMLVITAVITVIYINNSIEVNQLAMGNNELKEQIKKSVESNDLLRSEVERLSSFERIRSIAKEKFELTYQENSVDENNNIVLSKQEIK